MVDYSPEKVHNDLEETFNDQTSPFRPPNDEEVFVTRETEKQKRIEAKEMAKNLRIWDKNTATSAAPLRRIKDRDIAPNEHDPRRAKNFSSREQNHIHKAMHIARSRV